MIKKKGFGLLLGMFTLSAFIFVYPVFAESKVLAKETTKKSAKNKTQEQVRKREIRALINKTPAEQEEAKAEEAAAVAAGLIPRKTIGKDGRFIAYNDGTVLDRKSDLMWAAQDNGADITWRDAMSYCENYRGGGYTDWRMPTQDELAGLYDKNEGYKSVCGDETHLTALIRLTCHWTWASDTSESGAACFRFGGGGYRCWGPPSGLSNSRAFPVRSGK